LRPRLTRTTLTESKWDVTDAVGISTQTGYTNDELVATSMATPNAITHNTSYLYDAAGELNRPPRRDGHSTLTSYYPNGLTYTVSDALATRRSTLMTASGTRFEVWSTGRHRGCFGRPNW